MTVTPVPVAQKVTLIVTAGHGPRVTARAGRAFVSRAGSTRRGRIQAAPVVARQHIGTRKPMTRTRLLWQRSDSCHRSDSFHRCPALLVCDFTASDSPPASLAPICAHRLAGLPDLCILSRPVHGPFAPASARGRRGRSLVGRLGPRITPTNSRCSPFRRHLGLAAVSAGPASVPPPPPPQQCTTTLSHH